MRVAFGNPVVRRFALAELLLQTQFWFPIWFLFLRDLGFGIATIVVADALFRLTVVVFEIPSGMVADRIGRRESYLLLAGLTTITYLGIAAVQGTTVLLVVWVVWGVQWAATSGLGAAYLAEAVREHAPDVGAVAAFGAVRAAAGLTGVVSLASAGFLYAVDPRLPFLVTAGCALAALPVIAGLPRLVAAPAADQPGARGEGSWSQVVGDRRLVALIVGSAIVLVFGWSTTFLFQPLVLDQGMSEQAAAWMYTGFAAAGMAAGLLAPWATHRFRGAAPLVGFLVMVVASAGAGTTGGVVAVLFVPLLGLGYYLAVVGFDVAVSGRAQSAVRATALSAVSGVGGIVIAGARPSLGLISDDAGTGTAFALWAVVGLVLLPALVLALRAAGELGQAGPESDVLADVDDVA